MEQIEVRVPGRLDYLRPLRDLTAALCARIADRHPAGTLDEWARSVETAAAELAANIVRHAYRDSAGELRCLATAYDDRIEVYFFDRGASYVASPPTLPDPMALQASGYGMFLIHRLMDEVDYSRTPDGENRWRLVKQLPRVASSE